MAIMNTDVMFEHEDFSNLSEIQSFFYGQSVFLTGVTGLVGKVVLEKLLRCCPGIGIVYVLLRPKKGLTAEQRLEKVFTLELFKVVKEVFPQFRKKVHAVEGDITQFRLGLSFDDFEKIRQNVSIVLHSAASVVFTEPLKKAVESNVIPVIKLLELCQEMPHIKAMVHVSTAYVKREPDGSVQEVIPKLKVTATELLNALEWMDENCIKAVTDMLLEKKLTTYLVTKALAECAIQEKEANFPLAIVRPCYISPTYKEPFPGWIDALQGLSGLLLAGAKGALRTLRSVSDLRINVIPVDIVTNTIFASAWHVGTTKPAPLFIINCVMDYESLPYANEDILEFALKKRDEYPLARIFRYPDFTIHYNNFFYLVHALIDQWIPGIIIDSFLFIFTGKTILMKVYWKIHTLYDIFYRLGKDPWICRIDNITMLKNKLTKEDSKIFCLETDDFDWPPYMEACLYGGRKFLAGEDPSNIPYARKKAKIWWTVTTTFKWMLFSFVLYYVANRFFFNTEEKIFKIQP